MAREQVRKTDEFPPVTVTKMASHACPRCDEQFRAAGSLREHAWSEHGICHYCAESFDDEASLHQHWLRSHDDTLSRADRKRARATVGPSESLADGFTRGGLGGAVESLSRRQLLLVGGTIGVGGAAVAGYAMAGSDGPGSGEAAGTGDGSVADAPLPSSPGDRRYAVAGSDGADLTVTYFGSWKCPYCAQFSTGFLPTLVEDYVVPGDVALEYRNISYFDGEPFLGPDAPAAGTAGLAAWNVDPETYWPYHEYVFRNQPPESQRWATPDRLASFASEAGFDNPDTIRTAVEDERYRDALRATDTAARDAGVSGTPTLLVDGTTVSPFERDRTRRVIEDALP